jgi:Leucine-rich repeat (LRR) protein
MLNVHPNMKARINKSLLLEEVRYFQFMYKEILKEINSNALAVKACEMQVQELMKKDLEDMLFCIQLDNLLEKINAYIAMAILNEVEDDTLHLKYITRLPTLFFKLHMHKIKTLKHISIHNNKFKILYISPEIGHCHMLEILDCSNCKLTELPENIGSITNLKKLIVTNNELKELPESIGDLPNIKLIDVSNNLTLTKLPKELGDLTTLKIFKAHHAKLRTLPKEIANCSSLQELHVDNNQLKALPKELSRLNYLEILSIKNNKISDFPENMENMSSIRLIAMDGNEIKKVPKSIAKFCETTG